MILKAILAAFVKRPFEFALSTTKDLPFLIVYLAFLKLTVLFELYEDTLD